MHTCSTFLKMILKLSYNNLLLTFSTFSTYFLSGPISIRIDILCAQLHLDFSTDHWKLCMLVEHGLKICGWFRGYPAVFFFFFFFFSFLTLFSSYLFQVWYTCFTWSAEVHAVWGLSSHYFLSSFPTFRLGFSTSDYYKKWYLVGATSRISHRSLWNYTYFFYMVWKCANSFEVILLLFVINFFYFFNLPFPGLIGIRKDTLWAHLLLQLSTNHFDSLVVYSTNRS